MKNISDLTAEISRTFYDLQAENRKLRATIEKLAEKETRKPMACECCRNFIQHYIYDDRDRFVPIHLGHCTRGRMLNKAPTDRACKYFEMMRDENE